MFFTDCSKSELRKFWQMQNVHLLQAHIQRNRAWLRKHTEGQELKSCSSNQVHIRTVPQPRERFRNKRYICMSKERRKKNTLGKKGYNYSCAEFKGWRFLDILAPPPHRDLNSKAQTWMKMFVEFIQVPIKGKHLKASEYVCTAIGNTPFSKERKPHFLPLRMHSLQGERCLYFSHPTKHTCLKTKGEAGILIWQTFGQCYTLVISQYSSATQWKQEKKKPKKQPKPKLKLYRCNSVNSVSNN